jgi:galactokinase
MATGTRRDMQETNNLTPCTSAAFVVYLGCGREQPRKIIFLRKRMQIMAEAAPIHCKEYEITDKSERIVIAEAPGRLNMMGEHSQYGAGVLLACAVNKTVRVCVSGRKDTSLRFYTAETSERKRTTTLNIKFKREDRWANHIKLAIYLFSERGFEPRGLNFTVTGDLPPNIGLGSPEAVEVASVLALRTFYHCKMSDKDLIDALNVCHKEFYGGEDKLCDFLVMMNAKKTLLS